MQAGGAIGTIVLSCSGVLEFRDVDQSAETVYPYKWHFTSPSRNGMMVPAGRISRVGPFRGAV